ncbi:MAG: LuxR C-terminal-related transcriptional regulator [Armatimonadota bacterium]|nr:LuxR C-terminal-related transcriptional regulator [Armatimonadota bacterium]MDR7450773.1 LuxR C-terminal-related transcriptional regulator [Armatimonadota bacterium]MDR7466129.1 LuxR C-terminal-related transcriptional regulator [Armatimonadota bacterium]MDR7493834.1 LuxR C-terminal-related transcriptional regulator [Armatimonadota bacterium]MDR7499005.1 LuxR C-terminal-related transcriptional regulator [Armatimonadota bacterium]
MVPSRAPAGSSSVENSRRRPPPHPHRLIGREEELGAAQGLILRRDVRMLTITGPPGVGKTRFAIEVASAVASEFDDGALVVDLAPIRDPALVLSAIAQALGAYVPPNQPIARVLHDTLCGRNLLLVLDNFEQVAAAGPEVAGLLDAAPDIRFLITSREPLHVTWEREYRLSPLPVADPRLSQWTAIRRSPATALFAERAKAADPTFALDAANARTVAEICRRLDGLPLAIELAAAWIGRLDPEAILARLEARRGLPAEPSEARGRHRNLGEAIAWSYNLLGNVERAVFRRVGIFAGGCTVEAIEAICEDLNVGVLEPIASLADKNLLIRIEDPADGQREPRVRMLETIREFALQELNRAGETDAVAGRHARWFLALAERAEPLLWSQDQTGWLDRLDREHDNIRAALRWCFSGHGDETGARLAAAMGRFWFARGYFREGQAWLEAAASRQQVPARARARALAGLAALLWPQGKGERASRLAEEALLVARSVEDPALTGWVLLQAGLAADSMGDVRSAEGHHRELIAVAHDAQDSWLEARGSCNLAMILWARGETEAARKSAERALVLARRLRDRWLTSLVTETLGRILLSEEPEKARALLEESLALSSEIGHRWLLASGLESLAAVLVWTDRAEQAALLMGSAEELRRAIGSVRDDLDQAEIARATAAARERLGRTRFEAAWNRGRAMTVGEAVALALGRPSPSQERRTPHPGGLTGRETEIARHIAEGRTNRQIAIALSISERTVDTHVQNILNRLGLERRAQIAAWVTAHLPGSASSQRTRTQ